LWKVFAKVSDTLPNTDGVFDKPQMVTIDDYKPPRSLTQNARLHCMIRALSNHTGHSESELKDWFKAEYGPTKRLQVGSQGQVIPLSTTDYTKKQMMELMEHVDRVCAENGVYVDANQA
jgi:hypothetical protein